jgi:hypothetical protein
MSTRRDRLANLQQVSKLMKSIKQNISLLSKWQESFLWCKYMNEKTSLTWKKNTTTISKRVVWRIKTAECVRKWPQMTLVDLTPLAKTRSKHPSIFSL